MQAGRWGRIGNTLPVPPPAAILVAIYSNPGEASETLSLPHHQRITMGMRKVGEGSQPALGPKTFPVLSGRVRRICYWLLESDLVFQAENIQSTLSSIPWKYT